MVRGAGDFSFEKRKNRCAGYYSKEKIKTKRKPFIVKLFLEILIIFLASVNLVLSRFATFRLHQPTSLMFWAIKVFVSAISPILFLAGVAFAISGWLLNSIPAIAIGGISALLYLFHIIKITKAPDSVSGFENQFGVDWLGKIPAARKNSFLKNRYVVRLPKSPEPILHQNISFYTIPNTSRQLLCDIWQPPKNIKQSGLAFIYLHGSAWVVLDKDFGTRTFFKHLAQQGHVIMDVAYRLFPETDMTGMVHDAMHAIAWMKANAAAYHVNPDCIVMGGGSAGAHIALLAAYADTKKPFMPMDLLATDTRVKAVISLYGQADLAATYYHTAQDVATHSALATNKKGESSGMPAWAQKSMGKDFHRLGFDTTEEPGMLAPILGGNPDQKPEAYALYSPIKYVHKNCPATLFINGEHDILAPPKAIQLLYSRLKEVGVPVVLHVVPQTDHAFDLILPKISPSSHNAIYDVERFLALQVHNENKPMQQQETQRLVNENVGV
jgi:acetyl esterase/lipase